MRYVIQVHGHPDTSSAAQYAQQFIKAALAKGHEVTLVFFYYDGVCHGLRTAEQEDPVPALAAGWTALAVQHGLDLMLCIAAAERRSRNASHPEGPALMPGFRVGGLGQWLDACVRAERCVVFVA